MGLNTKMCFSKESLKEINKKISFMKVDEATHNKLRSKAYTYVTP